MNTVQKIGQTFIAFSNLLSELEPFVETQELRLMFDAKGQASLIGQNFCEPLKTSPERHRTLQNEMREIIAKHAPRKALPQTDRLHLIQTLNALPGPQFDELLFALNPPSANVPGNAAPQGSRSKALLEWIESPIGPGLPELEATLASIVATQVGAVAQASGHSQTVETLKNIIKALAANQTPKYDLRGAQFGGGFAETVQGDQIGSN